MKRVNITIIIIVLVFAFNCILTEAEEKIAPRPGRAVGGSGGHSGITVNELIEKIEQNEKFALLDVRTEDEFNQGHIEGAVLVPSNEIETRYKELDCSKCDEIIAYCLNGKDSQLAAEFLIKLGFQKTQSLLGGIEAWKEAGGEVIARE